MTTPETQTSCALRTTDDLLGELELALVAGKGLGDVEKRCRVTIAICAEARAILRAGELETENAELKKLLLERHPELRAQLKAVR